MEREVHIVLVESARGKIQLEARRSHLAAHDAVLWAADLAAWGWTRGGEFRAGIEPLVVARIRV